MRTGVPAVLVLAILLLAAVAGCLDGGEKKDVPVVVRKPPGKATTKEFSNPVDRRINDTPVRNPDATVRDWFVMTSRATPNGTVQGFQWTIPLGGVIGLRFAGQRGVVFEIAPIVVDEANAPTTWSLFPFYMAQGNATLVGIQQPFNELLGGTMNPAVRVESTHRQANNEIGGPKVVQQGPNLAPSFYYLSDTRLKEGDSLFFVLGAIAPSETAFGMAFRVVGQFPVPAERPTANLDEFLEDYGGLRPISVKPLGSAYGLHVSFFDRYYSPLLNATPVYDRELRTENMKADDRLPAVPAPGVTARDVTLASAYESPKGWSYVEGRYEGACATGRWSVTANLHGQTFLARSLIAQHILCGLYPFIAEYLLLGLPRFTFYREGDGPSGVTMEVQVVNGGIEVFRLAHVAFGGTISQLLGTGSPPYRNVIGGLAGNVPPGE